MRSYFPCSRSKRDPGCMPTDSDALFLEKVIDEEEDPELLRALKYLDDYLFRW